MTGNEEFEEYMKNEENVKEMLKALYNEDVQTIFEAGQSSMKAKLKVAVERIEKEEQKIGECPKCKGFVDILNREPMFWCGNCGEYYQRINNVNVIQTKKAIQILKEEFEE